jgi:hypothetical protein
MKAAARRPALSSFISFVNLSIRECLVLVVSHNHGRYAQVCRPSGECAKTRSKEHADIPDIDRKIETVKNIVDNTAGSHETGIYCSSNNTTKRVPCCRVKPVPKFLCS